MQHTCHDMGLPMVIWYESSRVSRQSVDHLDHHVFIARSCRFPWFLITGIRGRVNTLVEQTA